MTTPSKHIRHPVLFIHGGAGMRATAAHRRRAADALRRICDETYAYLRQHSAMDAVVFAVERLEDDPIFNAGTGSTLQADGRARMSAAVMDGTRRRFSGVVTIEQVRHPIDAAAALQDEADRTLAGAGATQFARSLGLRPWNVVTRERRQRWRAGLAERRAKGTVGAVALDAQGRLAAATSTGGKGWERIGRVSDSGLPVGNYATPHVAISCTGLGEDIVDEGLAVRLAQRVDDGLSLEAAFRRTFAELKARQRHVAAIGMDARGSLAWRSTMPVLYAVGRLGARRVNSFSPR